MIRISVKTDNSRTRKIQLFPVAENDTAFRVEIDRRRINRPQQRESVFTREDVLSLVEHELGWNEETADFEPVPPRRIPRGTRVVAISFDEDLMPRRRKTSTVSEPFLDWRGDWRVFVLGESRPVKMEHVTPDD